MVTKNHHTTSVYDFNGPRFRQNLLHLIDAELAVIEDSETQVENREVESTQLHKSTSYVWELEEPAQSFEDVIQTETATAPTTFQTTLVNGPQINLEYSAPWTAPWKAPHAIEPVLDVTVEPAQTLSATTHKSAAPKIEVPNAHHTQIHYTKLPADLFSKLVRKIGRKMKCRKNVKWNSEVPEIYDFAIRRFGTILKRLKSKAIDGVEWNTHNIKINSTSIDEALGRIKTYRDGKEKFSVGAKNSLLLHRVVCGDVLKDTSAPDWIKNVALTIYAHAVALYGDIDDTFISDDGLLFVDGKYFPSSAEISGSRASRAKKNKRKEANDESSEPSRDSDHHSSGEAVDLNVNLSVASEDAEMVSSDNQGVHTDNVEVQRPQHLSTQFACNDLPAKPAATQQVNCVDLPMRRLIQLVNMVWKAMRNIGRIKHDATAQVACGQVIDRFEIVLNALLLQFDEGREVNTHNVKINRTSIQTALGNISDYRKSYSELTIRCDSADVLVHVVCGNEFDAETSADGFKLAALHFYVHALTLHGNIPGISYGEDRVLRMGDRYFPTGAQIRAARSELKKRKRDPSDSRD